MNQRSLKVLEYDKIVRKVTEYCITAGGKAIAEALTPMVYEREIQRETDLTDQAVGMILRNGNPPLSELGNTNDFVNRAALGSMLSMEELLNIALLLRIVRDMDHYYWNDTQKESLGSIKVTFDALDPIEFLEQDISKKIISGDEMADDASPDLRRIRREMIVKNGRINEKLNSIITSSTYEKVLQERLITIRNNRYVVPVKQEYRHMIPGMVLDKSSSGATLFIEPMSVVNLNNELKELAIEEEQEITRILKQLTRQVANFSETLLADYELLTTLDFVFAKAKYALELGGERVALGTNAPIQLRHARHPLLDAKTAVASDIVLEPSVRTMIITGPNTGGKTVTLKTIGLLCLMAQSGLFVPVREGSSLRIFKEVYADIGDEQSIEQSLSTFSSHMSHIVEIMDAADQDALVLFDELGAGTDPTEGAALAIALLDNLHQRGGITCATTHYSELKEYALVTEGVTNASVEFDVSTLRPTYRLIIGMPGKSNAFEIAKRLGLDQHIIDAAKGSIASDALRFENTLEEIEANRIAAEKNVRDSEKMQADAEASLASAQKKVTQTEHRIQKMLEEAQKQADAIISETKAKTDLIYKEIRLIQETTEAGVSDNKRLEALRREMAEQEKSIYAVYREKARAEAEAQPVRPVDATITKGSAVHVTSLRQKGEVLEVLDKEGQFLVQVGMLKLKVEQRDCVAIEKDVPKGKQIKIKAVDRRTMSHRLDLRGRTGEEALFMVEKFISDAIMTGTHELLIIHGMGTGKLSKVIHAYLKNNPQVESFRLGGPSEGGAGATVVTL